MSHIVTLPDIHTVFGNNPKWANTAPEFKFHQTLLC